MSKESLDEIAGVFAETSHPAEARDLLLALLTPCERARLCLRWRLVRLLADGVPQREIARRLGVSLCKITRGSRELQRGPLLFRKIVEKHMTREKNK